MTNSIEYIVKANSSLYSLITNELSNQTAETFGDDNLTLSELDKWRTDELPEKLLQRYEQTKHSWLTKEELILLLDWKLAKGVFRPMLRKLIRENDQVEQITKAGFAIFLDYVREQEPKNFWVRESNRKEYVNVIKLSIKKISELRGVGPAMSSLILSLTIKINNYFVPPFFSDESFTYYVLEPIRPGSRIKYSVKEYTGELLLVYFNILIKNDDLNMDILEKGGWSLKVYDINKIDKLADIKLPFDIDNDHLHKYIGEEVEIEKTEMAEPKRKKLKKSSS